MRLWSIILTYCAVTCYKFHDFYSDKVPCHRKIISSEDIRFDICQKKKVDLGNFRKISLNPRQKLIYNYIQENNTITNREARKLIKISRQTINNDLTGMVKMGLIKKDGIGRAIFYTLKQASPL